MPAADENVDRTLFVAALIFVFFPFSSIIFDYVIRNLTFYHLGRNFRIFITSVAGAQKLSSVSVLVTEIFTFLTESYLKVSDVDIWIPPESGISNLEVCVYCFLACQNHDDRFYSISVATFFRKQSTGDVMRNASEYRYERKYTINNEFVNVYRHAHEGEVEFIYCENLIFFEKDYHGCAHISDIMDVTELQFATLLDEYNRLRSRGFTVLFLFVRKNNEKLKFIALVPLYYRPYPNIKNSIQQLGNIGIKTNLVSGCNKHVVTDFLQRADINSFELVGMEEIRNSKVEVFSQRGQLQDVNVVYDAFPEDNLYIIRKVQSFANTVGITGCNLTNLLAFEETQCGIALLCATPTMLEKATLIVDSPCLSNFYKAVVECRRMLRLQHIFYCQRFSMSLFVLITTLIVMGKSKVFVSAGKLLILVGIADVVAMAALCMDRTTLSIGNRSYNLSIQTVWYNICIRVLIFSLLQVCVNMVWMYIFLPLLQKRLSHVELQTATWLQMILSILWTFIALRSIPAQLLLVQSILRNRLPFWSTTFVVVGSFVASVIAYCMDNDFGPLSIDLIVFTWVYTVLVTFFFVDPIKWFLLSWRWISTDVYDVEILPFENRTLSSFSMGTADEAVEDVPNVDGTIKDNSFIKFDYLQEPLLTDVNA